MVAGGRRDVLFFGSLSVSVAGHDVYDDGIAAQLARQNAFIRLRATATAPYRKTDEVFSEVATSPLYEIHPNDVVSTGIGAPATTTSGTKTSNASGGGAPQQLNDGGIGGDSRHCTPTQSLHRHDPYRSRTRQRAAFLPVMLELSRDVAVEEVPSMEEMERELLHATQLNSTTSTTTTEAGGGSADNLTQVLNSGEVTSPSYASASVRIEVDMSRSGSRTGPVAIQEVFLPSLNYLAQHDICTIVRIPLLTSTIQKQAVREIDAAVVARDSAQLQSSGTLDGATGSGSTAAGVALDLYVVVRVVSLAEKARLAFEADEQLRNLLDAHEATATTSTTAAGTDNDAPILRMDRTLRGEAPYGVMPLTELYRHYKRFFEHNGTSAVLKHGDAIMQRLVTAPRQREADASFPHRWNALTEMDLRPLLLGERNFAPLLLTLAHCTNLRALYAEGNQLGDYTCARLAALLNRHRYLAYIGLSKNAIHEAGGEQLTRLLKKNPRITAMPCEGNYFSDGMRQRIVNTTAKNASVIANDPLNVFAASYSYLTEPSSLPEATQRQALRTWAMLSAAPVGDVDVMVRNLTTSSQRTIGDSPQVAMKRAKMAMHARQSFSLIPPAALAPLLNEVMRTVYVAVSRVLPDPLVRSLFTDMTAIVTGQQAEKDAQNSNNINNSVGGGFSANSRENRGAEDSNRKKSDSALPAEVAAALGGPSAPPLNSEKLFARSFLRIVVTVFRGLVLATPWAETAEVLEGIGRVHRDLGVMAEDYWLAVHVFMAAVRIICGSESYDADHASSFLGTLALAVRTTAGFDVQLE